MNIGIFSGSFDPIHVGHLILANYVVEFTEIEEVWFLVSPQNPLKVDKEMTDETIRYEMVKLALENYENIKASDFELSMPKPTYTIDTLSSLEKRYPEHTFSLIIGADNWAAFEKWKEYDKIQENYHLKVYPRLGSRITIPSKLRSKVEAMDSPIVEVSSTFIRESIREDKDVRAFLPQKVYNYIKENKLYK